MKEHELLKAFRSLPEHMSPERDLWPGISERLQSRPVAGDALPVKHSWRMPAIAAGLLVALAGGILIGRGVAVAPPPLARNAEPVLKLALGGSLQATQREYQAALQELLPLGYSGTRLAGDDPDSIRASWEDLRQTENRLLAALGQYPANAFLSEKFIDLKSRQLQFVKHLVMLEQNDWRKT